MTIQEWRKVKRIFNHCNRLNGVDRSNYLNRICAGDIALREQVEELLAQAARSTAFLVPSTGGADKISHYKILKRIGEGGMGQVYKAEDTRLRRLVAIKALPPWAAGSQDARDRLLEEARCASALNHPNIITIYEILQESLGDFIVMEYLSGRTLKDLIPPKGLPLEDVLHYAVPIADALDHAHASGILHRDLKPSNILVSDMGRVKLLDFGVAISDFGNGEKSEGKMQDLWGTALYMAPEQIQGAAADQRSDIFSFGVVLWEALTGKHPFGENSPNGKAIPKSLGPRLPNKIPILLQPFVRRCLELDPAKRYQSMNEVSVALAAVSRGDRLVTGELTGPSAQPVRSLEQKQAKAAVGRMNYESLAQGREAAEELGGLLKTSKSETLRSLVMTELRALILSVPRSRSGNVAGPVREIRKLALELLRQASDQDLRVCFRPKDFQHLDLWNMTFSGLDLAGFSFTHCFLTQSNFEGCNLRDAEFSEAWIRNVNFSGSDLAGSNFTETDWFNAIGLTEKQLASVRPGTLMECPANEARLREYLDDSYGFPIGSWSDQVRDQLLTAWSEYLRPGGLRDFVNHLRRTRR